MPSGSNTQLEMEYNEARIIAYKAAVQKIKDQSRVPWPKPTPREAKISYWDGSSSLVDSDSKYFPISSCPAQPSIGPTFACACCCGKKFASLARHFALKSNILILHVYILSSRQRGPCSQCSPMRQATSYNARSTSAKCIVVRISFP